MSGTAHAIHDAEILHAPRLSGASDHAGVLVELALDNAVPAPTGTADRPTGSKIEALHDSPPVPVIGSGKHQTRFDLAPGTLSDMICGYNGKNHQRSFRPTYVTAEWGSGVLREVRIWGPQILQDGSLGRRELDHPRRIPIRAGGVDVQKLPAPVAALLRAYATSNGLRLPWAQQERM